MQTTDRRTFLKEAGVGAAALSFGAAQLHAAGSDRTKIAVIGPGGMGSNHTRLLANRKDVEIVSVCDVDQHRLERAVDIVKSGAGTTPKAVTDMRNILKDKDCGSRVHRHARPLARPRRHPRLGTRQARLCRKTHVP